MLQVELIIPERKVLEQEVSSFVVETLDGEIGVLQGHANLLSTVRSGKLCLNINQQNEYLAIHHGFISVVNDKVSILVKYCERADEIDLARAEVSEKDSLEKIKSSEGEENSMLKDKLSRSLTRQNLTKNYGRNTTNL